MIWTNFLHIYQPPTQKQRWVRKIANESYRKLIRGFLDNPKAKVTMNVNAVLLELFDRYGCQDVIAGLRELGERGQIEFTASAKYHPFLPLMPETEIVRQIGLNTETNRKYLGPAYQPKGFFPPEMAYNRRVGEIVSKLGFRWIILDELASAPATGTLSASALYEIKGIPDFYVFFRDRAMSFRILSAQVGVSVFSSNMLLDFLGDRLNRNEYLLTAMDGETFGHHRPGLEMLLFEIYKAEGITSLTISQLFEHFHEKRVIDPRDSTWALMRRDLERNTPFSRWKNEQNKIQIWQWELTDLAIRNVEHFERAKQVTAAQRAALDRALHSDQYWWASAEPWWSIEMIEAGAKELRDVVLSLSVSAATKRKAEELYKNILYRAFDWQRSGKVETMAKMADEDVTQRITTEIPYIPEEEFNTIVANLTKQMKQAADALEYERAAQIRERISELNAKKDEITQPKEY